MEIVLPRRSLAAILIALCGGLTLWIGSMGTAWGRPGTYRHFEVRFDLPGITGNPFDYTVNDIQVTVRGPGGGTVSVPAFYDGGTVWRARLTPRRQGRYLVAKVTRNGVEIKPEGLSPREFAADGPQEQGFVRIDPQDPARFAFDDGERYYPLGNDAAWRGSDGVDIPVLLARMGAAGENWSRVWMNHWDGKNLDWPTPNTGPGTLNLETARKWDAIVDAAERNGIYFQMTLQHHGQYSSTVNPNWGENPWNAANHGGFLKSPEAFFTDPRALALTRAKYRYIVARWGYSPHILAWELFNEVEFTDAARNGHADTVAAWHRQMAGFLRQQDPNHHLVTTSSSRSLPGLYDAVNYLQPHAYVPDPITALGSVSTEGTGGRPIFFGECGPSGDLNGDHGSFLHAALWASLMGNASGAAQYWSWEVVNRDDLYRHYAAASAFLKATKLETLPGAAPITPTVKTVDTAPVAFAPGGGWGAAKQTEFTVPPSGQVDGIGALPTFLQGKGHREMFPAATFQVDYPKPGTFAVRIGSSARAGAHLVIQVDGTTAAEKEFPAADADQHTGGTTVSANVPAGKHTIRLENTGADWVTLDRITLAPYGSGWRALGKGTKDHAGLWLFRTAADATGGGTVTVPGLAPGFYRVTWYDTMTGRSYREEKTAANAGRSLTLALPTDRAEAAVFIVPSK